MNIALSLIAIGTFAIMTLAAVGPQIAAHL